MVGNVEGLCAGQGEFLEQRHVHNFCAWHPYAGIGARGRSPECKKESPLNPLPQNEVADISLVTCGTRLDSSLHFYTAFFFLVTFFESIHLLLFASVRTARTRHSALSQSEIPFWLGISGSEPYQNDAVTEVRWQLQ